MKKTTPLAHSMRPVSLSQFIGLENLYKRYPFLKQNLKKGIIFWGPPGCGKTTLAQVLAKSNDLEFYQFNAVLSGLPELRKLIDRALEVELFNQKPSAIFIDEIHRFNKAQQDALLPHIEEGRFILLGATTEYPQTSINRALLSRLQVVELKSHSQENIVQILTNAGISKELGQKISYYSDGDARRALNLYETIKDNPDLTEEDIERLLNENARLYDKSSDRHYDVISAFIKSMRGSDPQAALLYLAIMLEGGEDPIFIARRLVIFASEDVGNADINGINLATNALIGVQNIGMPEARIILSQVTTYLATTVKSNAAYLAINEAMEYVRSQGTIDTPNFLKNHHPEKNNYKYPHNYPDSFVAQSYTSKPIPNFYRPKLIGHEERIAKRLLELQTKSKQT